MSQRRIIKSFCRSCHGYCGVLITIEDGIMTKIEGDPQSLTKGTMCPKGLASIQEVYNPNRLKYPLRREGKRGEGKWQRISWEEALDTIADRIKDSIEKFGPHSICVGQGTGRGYDMHTLRFCRSIGTGNALNPALICYLPRLYLIHI